MKNKMLLTALILAAACDRNPKAGVEGTGQTGQVTTDRNAAGRLEEPTATGGTTSAIGEPASGIVASSDPVPMGSGTGGAPRDAGTGDGGTTGADGGPMAGDGGTGRADGGAAGGSGAAR